MKLPHYLSAYDYNEIGKEECAQKCFATRSEPYPIFNFYPKIPLLYNYVISFSLIVLSSNVWIVKTSQDGEKGGHSDGAQRPKNLVLSLSFRTCFRISLFVIPNLFRNLVFCFSIGVSSEMCSLDVQTLSKNTSGRQGRESFLRNEQSE